MEFIRREHLAQHLVVTLVRVHGLDDPVTPMPDVLLRIANFGSQSPPIAVTPDIHPMPAPALTILRTVEQPRDDAVVCFGRWIGHECVEFFSCRRHTNQVERHAPQPDSPIGFLLGRDPMLEMFAGNESIDWISLPAGLLDRWLLDQRDLRPHGGLEGPMIARVPFRLLIRWSLCVLFNPVLQRRNLIGLQRFTFRRHPLGLFGRRDAFQQWARGGIAGLDHRSRLAPLDRQRRRVETQSRLLLEGSMTGNTARREYRLDLAQIVHAIIRQKCAPSEQACR